MSEASANPFSFTTSKDDEYGDFEIIRPCNVAGATNIGVLPTEKITTDHNKSATSCTVTKDSKETADKMYSAKKFLAMMEEEKKEKARKKKEKDNLRIKRKLRSILTLLISFHLITLMPLDTFDDLMVRSFVPEGLTEFRVKSFSLYSFSSAFWISPEINAKGELSLEVRNFPLYGQIRYDPIEISITHNGTVLSTETLDRVVQPLNGKWITLNVPINIRIDGSVVEHFVKPDYEGTFASFDVSVRAKIMELKSEKRSKTLRCSCNDVVLRFPNFPYDGLAAEMFNDEPVICRSQSYRAAVTNKFNSIFKKSQGIIRVFL